MKTIELVLQPEEAANENIINESLRKLLALSNSDSLEYAILKRSIDARARNVKIRFVLAVSVNEKLIHHTIEERKLKNISNAKPVVIIGCGPAGLFAAIRLIELGYKPLIVERGKNSKERRRDLATLNRKGVVNPHSNYCFGEGGAGTYSDGKLFTRSGKRGSIEKVLGTFIQFGAKSDIAIDAHPHIGTNKLPGIIEAMRKTIIECGGEVLFNNQFISFKLIGKKINGVLIKNTLNNNELSIDTESVILATGHSARDIYEYFHLNKFTIEAKSFALGVRIEHPQSIIDASQYHCTTRNTFLPPASYSFTHQHTNKGVYSFCMCPGGIIAPAATAPGEIVVNGWSPSKRNNPFANSGIVVNVDENDIAKYSKFGMLASLRYQQSVERNAYIAGGGNLIAPAQRMVDFLNNKQSDSLPKCSYIPGVKSVNLNDILPKEISLPLKFGLKEFGKKMKGYSTNEAILLATESRTSSPVRIPRDKETLMHTQLSGLFPCAEGAGYAGGIVSAAMDGEKCAEAAVKYLSDSSNS